MFRFNVRGLLMNAPSSCWMVKDSNLKILSWCTPRSIPFFKGHDESGNWFCLTSRSCSSYSAHQNSRQMQKLLSKKGGKTTKKRWFEPHFAEPLESPAPKSKKGHSHRHMARVRQVSHVLYDKITHVINSGELCQDLLEKQINITSVLLHKDMNGINVYWEADRTDWEDVEKMLEAKRGKLRSLLISYHVLGKIAPITFVRAKQFCNMSEVDTLLEVADYGPDYITGQSSKEIQQQQQQGAAASFNHVQPAEVGFQSQQQGEQDIKAEDFFCPSHDNRAESENSPSSKSSTNKFIIDSNSPAALSSTVESMTELGQKDSSPHLNFQTLEDTNEDNRDYHCSSTNAGILPELNFRSDLYGLRRDDMMNKVVAQKKGLPVVQEGELPSFSLKLDSVFKKNSVLSKKFLKQKALKEDNKWKAKLLEREFF